MYVVHAYVIVTFFDPDAERQAATWLGRTSSSLSQERSDRNWPLSLHNVIISWYHQHYAKKNTFLLFNRLVSSHQRWTWTKFAIRTLWPGKDKKGKAYNTNRQMKPFYPLVADCRFLFSPPQDYWEGVAGCRKFQKSEVMHEICWSV